jgi:pimeloyl-ACP methyl ester carboxylesterase
MTFVPSHVEVSAPGAEPSRWMLVLHGILGSGGNFRSFARRLAVACPAWGFVLVDLRMHGQSQGAPPPHTIASAADDLVRLREGLGRPVAAVMGHSFGGKVALAYTERAAPGELEQAWVLDASPGTRRDRASSTEAIVRMLREIPEPLPSRERFVEIVCGHGHDRAIADWLAMNLRRTDDGLRLRLDLDAIDALLDSYLGTDLWPVLAEARGARAFHVVVAGRSDAWGPADRAELAALAAREPAVRAHVIEDAGHWVHVDAPDALFELMRAALAEG